MAAAEGHAAVVEFLVENGVAINVQDRCVAINVQHLSLALLLCLLCVSGCACPLLHEMPQRPFLYEMPEMAVGRRDERCVERETKGVLGHTKLVDTLPCCTFSLLSFSFSYSCLLSLSPFLTFLYSLELSQLSHVRTRSRLLALSLSLSHTHTRKTCMHETDRLTHQGRWGGTALKDAQRGGHKAVQDLLTKAGATYGYDDTSQVLVYHHTSQVLVTRYLTAPCLS